MSNRYLVLSDLHLCDIEEHPDGWKAYKSARYSPDADLAELIDSFASQAGSHDSLTLVLNGDIFDFDLITAVPDNPPWPVSGAERKRGLLPTAEKSAWKMQRMLHDHPVFVQALARFLARGHRLVYVMGNHDRELHFPEVQDVFRRAVLGHEGPPSRRRPDSVRFEPWFFHVPGEIYAEHGQQYDYYSCYRHVLWPVIDSPQGPQIALPMGNLSNRHLLTQMGYFNPHASDFVLNAFRYLHHWLKYYAFTRRRIITTWFWESLTVIFSLLRIKKHVHRRPDNYDTHLRQLALRSKLPLETIRALGALQRPPITHKFYRIVREFWIDRLLIAIILTLGTVVLALSPTPMWAKIMIPLSSFPLLYMIYEWLARGETVFTYEREIPVYARRIAELTGVPLVTFGHTHAPRVVPLSAGTSFVDSGTWAPMTPKPGPAVQAAGYRNYLVATFDRNGGMHLVLDSWTGRPQSKPAPVTRVRLAS